MIDFPYRESTPLLSLDQETQLLWKHLENFHFYIENDYVFVAQIEWQYFCMREKTLNDGLLWC